MSAFKYKKGSHCKLPDKKQTKNIEWRIIFLKVFFTLFAVVIIFRLFSLQIIDHNYYYALASDQYEFFEQLNPDRGDILIKTTENNQEMLYPIATNQDLSFVYAVPRQIKDPQMVTDSLCDIFDCNYTEEDIPEPKDPTDEQQVEELKPITKEIREKIH